MSWIKDNKFLVGLVGGTLAGVILLYFVGSKGAKRYEEAEEAFASASSEASNYERSPLYPKEELRDGKKKALDEYSALVEDLQASFDPYRPGKLQNISPQEFTNNLKKVNQEVSDAFEEAGTVLPEAFFTGFEDYRTKLARRDSTGILNFQLSGIRRVLLDLAKAGPSQLFNVYRPALPEEQGGSFNAPGSEVARGLPLEIAFQGREQAARSFVSAIASLDKQFVVIRSIRVRSSKQTPPKSEDVKFERPTEAAAEASIESDDFADAFVLPDEEGATEEAADAAPEVEEDFSPTVAESSDSSRILAQVLGNEEVQVFVRLDLMQFLPAKKLP